MATYDGLPWIPAPGTHHMKGRQGYSILWGVVHDTESPEGTTGAEGNAKYLQSRKDIVSFHSVVDADSVVRCVRDEDTAYCARNPANLRGLHQEIVGRASQSKQQWADATSKATLALAARDMARWCRKHGIPARWLTDAQLKNREKGLTTHAQVARVFGGTHSDPGPNFPFADYLAAVNRHLAPERDVPTDTTEDGFLMGLPDKDQIETRDRVSSLWRQVNGEGTDDKRPLVTRIGDIERKLDAVLALLEKGAA